MHVENLAVCVLHRQIFRHMQGICRHYTVVFQGKFTKCWRKRCKQDVHDGILNRLLLFFSLEDHYFLLQSTIPFSLFNATQILSIAHLQSCSLDRSAIPATTETAESKSVVKSIKKWVQNLVYHQKSINPWSISGAAGNKSPKSGRSRSVR